VQISDIVQILERFRETQKEGSEVFFFETMRPEAKIYKVVLISYKINKYSNSQLSSNIWLRKGGKPAN
jgi:glutamate synthase domain-containing protein 1